MTVYAREAQSAADTFLYTCAMRGVHPFRPIALLFARGLPLNEPIINSLSHCARFFSTVKRAPTLLRDFVTCRYTSCILDFHLSHRTFAKCDETNGTVDDEIENLIPQFFNPLA